MTVALAVAMGSAGLTPAWSSDHFDSPAMTANPQADIADVYAWTAPGGHRLNLAMTVVGHSLSDRLRYVLHIDSGKIFGRTSTTSTITCRFPGPRLASCQLGEIDTVEGDASDPQGLMSRNGHFRLFAGLRDDPFYNNIKGSLAAYGAAAAAVKSGTAPVDGAGCAHFDPAVTRVVADQWQHTDGGPATNLLATWTVSAIVISIDLDVITKGGPILGIWGTTSTADRLLDRMARPFVGNTLLGTAPFSADDASGTERQAFNTTEEAGHARFATVIEKSLAFEDSLDGQCGNQLLANKADISATRYQSLARLFADDRLWVNSNARVCRQFFAVELAAVAGLAAYGADCGGRSPVADTPNMWRSLLVSGTTNVIAWDGLRGDEHPPSETSFPFLAAPDAHGVNH